MDYGIEYNLVFNFDTKFQQQISQIIIDNWGYNYGLNGFGYASIDEYKLWKKGTKFLVASLQGNIVGFVAYEKYSMANCSRFTPCLSCLWVHDTWRSKGIGKELVNRLCTFLHDNEHIDEVYLWLTDDSLVSWFESIQWKYLVKWVYLQRWVTIMYRNIKQ